MNDIRFGNPVSASWCAMWWMRACAAWRSRMSRTIVMRRASPLRTIVRTMSSTGDALAALVDDHALVGRLLARRDHRRLTFARWSGAMNSMVSCPSSSSRRVAHELAQRRVGIDDQAVLVEDDALGARLHELRQALLGFAQRLLGLAVLRDVGDQHVGADGLVPSPSRCGSRLTSIQRALPSAASSMRS